MKFSIKDFFCKYDQIRSLLKKFLMENFIFCAVNHHIRNGRNAECPGGRPDVLYFYPAAAATTFYKSPLNGKK